MNGGTALRYRIRIALAGVMAAAMGVVLSPLTPVGTATAAGPASDDFNSGTYSGGFGWNGSWVESGDGASGAGGGTISIVGGQLRFTNIDGDSISRDVDLSGFQPGAQVSFLVVNHDDDEQLDISFWNGSSYVLAGRTNDVPNGTRLSFTVPAGGLRSDGAIRIDGADTSWGSSETITIDDLSITDHVPNPDLDASCGIDVDVILDESGSIDSIGGLTETENAVRALSQGLAGTTSRIRFVEFSTTGRNVELGDTFNTSLQTVDADLLGDIDAYLDGAGATGNPRTYSPSDGTTDNLNFTNWEAGLARAEPTNADLVVFITDGVPNTVGTTSPTNDNGGGAATSAAAAVEEAQAVRTAGTKLLGIGVGQVTVGTNLDRLVNLVEPNNAEIWTGPADGPLNISTVDVIQVDEFADLDDALRQVVFALCSPSVSITKVNQAQQPVPGLDFTGTVQITEPGEAADDFEWVSPMEGTAGAPDIAGVSQTVTTGGTGTALFQWVPNTVDDPELWTSSFSFTETLDGAFEGWTLPASQPACSVDRLLADPDPDGPITETFPVDLVASGPDQDDVVTFTLERDGQSFQIEKADIVKCTVVNNEPATITIEKDIVDLDQNGQDPTDFGFTGGLGDFALDVDDDQTLPDSRTFTVAPGVYTVTENDPTASSYELSAIQCTPGTGQPSGAVDLDNRSVGITVGAGEEITCVFTNTQVPTANLTVTKTPSVTSFPEQDGTVTYTVDISNPNGAANPITITDIRDVAVLNALGGGTPVDVLLGDATLPKTYPGGSLTASDCSGLIGQTVGDTPLQCDFTVAFTDRNAADDIDDTVTVTGIDQLGNPIQRDASAQVTVDPVPPSILVDKQNLANESIVAPGGTATYEVTITNNGTVEDLVLTGVSDVLTINGGTPFGTVDLTTDAAPLLTNTCNDPGNVLVGTVLAPGEDYTCSFSLDTTSFGVLAQGDTLTNTITVTGRDDDPTPQTVEGSDPATRTILGEPPAITVFKTDNGAEISEPGEQVVYDVDISNQSLTETVTITRITDQVYVTPNGGARVLVGTLVVEDTGGGVTAVWTPTADNQGADFVSTTCDATDDGDGGIGSVLAINGADGFTTSCTITLFLPGDAGDVYDDKVVVDGVDEIGQDPVQGENTAETPVVNVDPLVSVTKTPDPTSVPEYGPAEDRTVTFTVVVTNDSVSTDPLTITALADTDFGNLLTANGNGLLTSNTCTALSGVVLQPGASSDPCTFTAVLSGTVSTPHENTVTVTGTDDEGKTATAEDDAVVDFDDVAPTIQVTKTANPTSVPETGGDVTYTIVVENLSGEQVTITELDDDRFGDLNLLGSCVGAIGTVLQPNDGDTTAPELDTYSCQFVENVGQEGNELAHVNVVTAKAVDDEQTEATDDDDATVTYLLLPPDIEITKTDNDAEIDEPGGPVTFDIVITNPETATEDIVSILTLSDVVTFEDPAGDVTVNLLGGPSGILTANGCPAAIAAALPLEPGDSVACSFTLLLSGLTAQDVSDVVTVVGLDNDGQTATDDASDQTPILDVAPTVQIVKTANPTLIASGESTTYSFEITNLSNEPLFIIDLFDDKFGSLNFGSPNGLDPDCSFSEATPVELAPNGQLGDSITCEIELTPDFVNDGVNGAHTNVATVTAGDDEIVKSQAGENPLDWVTDSDDETVFATSDVSSDKEVNEALTGYADGVWTVVYDITARNDGAGPDVYSIDDELGFGAGTDVQSVTATVETAAGGPLNPDFDPDPTSSEFDPVLVTDVAIAGNTTHVYRVTVEATVPTPTIGAGVCDVDQGTNGGFLNTATVTVDGEERDPDRACEPFNTLTLVKDLVGPQDEGYDGGEATLDDFLLTATPSGGDEPIVSGTGQVTAAVPAGTYDLEETTVAGYTPSGWSCTVGESSLTVTPGSDATEGSVTVELSGGNGVDVRCEITNDDEPVDLELTKDDGGAFAVAGGPAFPYTITVTNVGDRPVDLDEDVTVVDQLPDGFQWISFPSNPLDLPVCAIDGSDSSILRCDVDPADLGVGGEVVISTTVTASDDTPAGTYTNKAWVTTEDDPVCEGEDCTPPPCPTDQAPNNPTDQAPNNNVDCEETPVDNTATLTIVKIDDVADGVDIEPGDSFTYSIAVTNNGPQPVEDVVVTDTVPAALTVTSVSGSGWNCSATVGNAVSCTRAAQLAPSTIAPVITISVTLDEDFVGDSIENTGVAVGDVVKPEGFPPEQTDPVEDDETTPVRSLDVSAFLPTCVADSPYIVVDIDAVGFDATGDTITLTFFDKDMNPLWFDADGNVVVGPVAGGTPYTTSVDVDGNPLQLSGQRVLFPGASLDPLDWPGWALVDGVWVEDPSDDFLRDGVFVQVDVNPTALTGLIEYPPATSACANPNETDLAIVKDGPATPVGAGDEFEWTLTVTNNGPNDAEQVVISDDVPSGVMTVVSATSPDFDCSQNGNLVTCTGDSLAAGASGSVTIRVTTSASTPAGEVQNTATVESETPDSNPDNNRDDATALVDNTATLSIDKVDDVTTGIEPGDSFTYSIAVTNNGPQPVDNVVVTDTVPAMLTVDSVGGTGWNCSGTVGNAISCTRAAELGANVIAPVIVVEVTLDADFVGTVVENTGVVVADVVKPEALPAEKTPEVRDTERTPVRSLDVSAFLPTCVADSPYIVVDIDALGFDGAADTITLTFFDKDMNPLWFDADGNVVVGPVAGGTPYTTSVDFDGNPLQLSGQRVLFPGASLDPLDWPGWALVDGVWVEDPSDDFLRDGVFVQVDVNPTALTGLIEYPPATSACANPGSTEADLAIVKDGPATPVGAGNSFDWELEITNNGPDPAVDVVVSDLVPSSMTVTGVASSDFECTRNGNDVTCTRDALAAGASGTVVITVSVPADAQDGPVTNVATVESNVPDPDLTNNSDDASVDIVSSGAVTPTTVPPPVTLPPTGSDSTHQGIVIALWLLAAGIVTLGITRRRRTAG